MTGHFSSSLATEVIDLIVYFFAVSMVFHLRRPLKIQNHDTYFQEVKCWMEPSGRLLTYMELSLKPEVLEEGMMEGGVSSVANILTASQGKA